MTAYVIQTARETYRVSDAGLISRFCLDWKYSGEWKALALVRRNNFGVLETIPFAEWPQRLSELQWSFKNSKPRYTLRDMDHGTVREWGEMVLRVYEVKA
jgi:hypothetical protein